VFRATIPARDDVPAFDTEFVRLLDATDTRPDVILCSCPNQRQTPVIALLVGRPDGTPYPPNEQDVLVIVRASHEAKDFDALCACDLVAPLYWIREGRAHVPCATAAASDDQIPGERRKVRVQGA
jgi:hypothetical protein